MRTQFVQTNSRACAKSNCAWAAKVVKVDGGYMCFECVDDYNTWRGQKKSNHHAPPASAAQQPDRPKYTIYVYDQDTNALINSFSGNTMAEVAADAAELCSTDDAYAGTHTKLDSWA